MNIVIIGTAYPLRGGIAHFNALLARHLKSHHQVATITFKRQYPAVLFPGKTQEEQGTAPGDISPAPQLVDSINPLNWITVARRVRSMNPDLIIFKYWLPFFGPCFGTIAKLAKRGTAAKVLYICDNIVPHERRPGDLTFTRYAFQQADSFIVQSDAVERDLNRLFPGSRYRKVAHPVYENFGSTIPKPEARKALGISAKKVILYFGYVRPYKGLMVLFDAMKRIASASQPGEILLLAVGECYDDETAYRSYLRENGLESVVRFVPEYVPSDRVADYFGAADVVVLPYKSATQSGIVQIAYNFEKPVIATDVGGLAEVVKDGRTGFIVPPNDPQRLADAVTRYYDEQREEEFVGNVRKEKLKYSWANLVDAIEDLASSR